MDTFSPDEITPNDIQRLLDIKLQCDAGIISPLEAGFQQMQILLDTQTGNQFMALRTLMADLEKHRDDPRLQQIAREHYARPVR